MRNTESIRNLNNIKIPTKQGKVQGTKETLESFQNLVEKLKEDENSNLADLSQILTFQGFNNFNVELLKENLENTQALENIKLSNNIVVNEEAKNSGAIINFKSIDLKDLLSTNKEVNTFFQKLQIQDIKAEGQEEKNTSAGNPKVEKTPDLNSELAFKGKTIDTTENNIQKQNVENFVSTLKNQVKDEGTSLENEGIASQQQSKQIEKDTVNLTFKVGDGDKINSKAFAQEIEKKILIDFKEGTKDYEIQLEPLNLGKIKIKVVQEGMKTLVSIICSEQKTASLLNINSKEINNLLNNPNRGDITIDISEESYLNHEREPDQDSRKNKQQYQQNKEQNDSREFANKMRIKLIEPELA